jgi:prevent-host-death family protein
MGMSESVNVHQAKTHFSKLLSRVGKGEEIIISKSGRPVARLVPFEVRPAQRVPGSAKGKVTLSKDFMDPLPEALLESFEE